MNRAFCLPQYVVLWTLCVLFAAASPYVWGQNTLPPLTPVNVLNFTIPFEFNASAETIREVELLVSKDRGRRWYSVAKQPVESKKFSFQADSNGEFWFTFRTTTLTGAMSPLTGMPQLRVLVDTNNPRIVVPSQPSESGPLTPPKPERYREGKPIKSAQQTKTVQTESAPNNSAPNNTDNTAKMESTTPLLGPRLPGFDPAAFENKTDSDLLNDLMSGMDPFLDIQPAAVKGITQQTIAADKSTTAAVQQSANSLPGTISGIFLSNTSAKPQIVVKWNTGSTVLREAQIDVLRSVTKEGQRFPIAINLPNNGEYWWFLTPEDLKPFYITIRIRSTQNGIQEHITQTAITIDPQLPLTSSIPNNKY